MDTPETPTAPQPPPPPPWTVCKDYADKRRFKQYGKKHPREVESCLGNLDDVSALATQFGDLSAFHVGFLRNEFGDVWRIGQTGVPHAKETRLYIYAVRVGRTFYILTIGDKDTQQADLARAAELAAAIERDLHHE